VGAALAGIVASLFGGSEGDAHTFGAIIGAAIGAAVIVFQQESQKPGEGPLIKIKRLEHGMGIDLPSYATAEAAGMDLRAAVPEEAPVTINPGDRTMIPFGFCMEMPRGYEMQVRPRSGLALKHGITVVNTPGTVDSDYRGEMKVLLINHSNEPFTIRRGERVAQGVVSPVLQSRNEEVETLSETARGEGGFGSTGKH
jgi:dUTP pyrophosphatase